MLIILFLLVYYFFYKISKLKKTLLSLFSFNLISKFISGVYTILLIQFLSVGDYALYTNFQAVYSFMGGFVFTAFNFALIKYTADKLYKAKENPFELYIMVLLLNVIVFVPFLVAALWFSKDLSQFFFSNQIYKESVEYGCLASFGLIISNTILSIFQAEEDFKTYNLFNILRSILVLLGLVVLYYLNGLNFNQIALSLFWIQIGLSLIFLYKIFKAKGVKINFVNGHKGLWIFVSKIKYLLFYFIVYSIFEQVGVFILSRYSNEFELANFGVAFRYYYLAIILLLTAVNVVLLPKFSKEEANNNSEYNKKFAAEWIKKTWWLIFPIIIALYFSKPIYVFVNGHKYEYSYTIFCIFSIGLYFSLVFGSLTNILIGKGNHKYLFYTISSTFVLNLIISSYYVNLYGAVAVAASSVLSYNIIFHVFVIIKIFSHDSVNTKILHK